MIEKDDAFIDEILKEFKGGKLSFSDLQDEKYLKEIIKEIEETRHHIHIQKEHFEETYHQLDEAWEDIQVSLKYAKRFQDALMPSLEILQNVFDDIFVLNKPKNVVSGDFYWFKQIDEDMIVFALMDCTGHGVPGAFMTLLGYDLLDDIVTQRKIYEPDAILRNLHIGVRRILRQHETQNRDGMDGVICVIDTKNKTLEYAGAHNPLLLIQDGQYSLIKADKFAVGGYEKEGERKFTKTLFAN